MMRITRLLLVVVLLLVQLPLISAQGDKKRPESHVILISIDGLVPDYYLKPDRYGLKIPNIRQLCQQGSYAEAMESIYPSLTYPAHTSLVTGVRPGSHGVLSNVVWSDPVTNPSDDWYWYERAIKTPTLWTEARKAGLRSAGVGWPVTVGSAIDYDVPEIWKESPLKSMQTGLDNATAGLADKIKPKLEPLPGPYNDEARTRVAEAFINDYKPNLMVMHIVELDFVHHNFGPFSSQAYEKMEQIDALLGRLMAAVKNAGIADQTTWVIVSDHGFMKVEKEYHPGLALAKEGLITVSKEGKLTDWQAMFHGTGGSTAIYLKNSKDTELEKRVVALFEAIANQPNSPIYRVVKRDELKQLNSNTDAACMLDAAAGFSFGKALTGDAVTPSKKDKGTHGQLPSRPELYASFIISGRGVRVGTRLPYTRNINVAPTIAALLGFSMPSAEGRPIREILTVPVPKPARGAVK